MNIYLTLLACIGLIGGNLIFDSTLRKTNGRALFEENKEPLDIYGDEEFWLVLAQKYREYGINEIPGKEKDFSNQKDPGFLDKETGEYYVASKDKRKTHDRDDDIAKEIRKQCRKGLNFNFEKNSYEKVKRGCVLELPDYVKKVLKWQRDNGNCRLWLVTSIPNMEGGYPGEAIGKKIDREIVGTKTVLEGLWDSLENDFSSKIGGACKHSLNKIVPLSQFKKYSGKDDVSIVGTTLQSNQIDRYLFGDDK